MEYLYWGIVLTIMFIGFLGSILPLLPGTTFILLGVLLQKWLLPDTLSWLAIGWIAAFWMMSVVADIGFTLLGTKLFGGGKWGMAGASGGAFVGMFFSLPAILLGTMVGAVFGEKWGAKRTNQDALRAGGGAAIGFIFGGFARFSCAVAMITLYVLSILPAVKVGA